MKIQSFQMTVRKIRQKQLMVSNFALSLIVFKWHHGSKGVESPSLSSLHLTCKRTFSEENSCSQPLQMPSKQAPSHTRSGRNAQPLFRHILSRYYHKRVMRTVSEYASWCGIKAWNYSVHPTVLYWWVGEVLPMLITLITLIYQNGWLGVKHQITYS